MCHVCALRLVPGKLVQKAYFMKGFFLGLLVAALVGGGYWLWKNQAPPPTEIVIAPHVKAPEAPKKKKRTRGATRVARPGTKNETHEVVAAAVEPEPEPVRLTASDLKMVGQGDDLSRPDVVHLDLSDGQDARELSQEDIDARFRAQESAILGCITSSRPDPETYVPGRLTIKFRIQRAGTVRGVRVEAPAVLQKGGLYNCIKAIVGALRFPASGSSQIVSYPFTLS